MGNYEDHTQDAIDYGMSLYGSEIQKLQRINNLKKIDKELKNLGCILYKTWDRLNTLSYDSYPYLSDIYLLSFSWVRKRIFNSIKIRRRKILSMIRRLENTPTVLDVVVEKIYENLKKNNRHNKYVTVPWEWDKMAFAKPRTISLPLIFDEFVGNEDKKREQENE